VVNDVGHWPWVRRPREYAPDSCCGEVPGGERVVVPTVQDGQIATLDRFRVATLGEQPEQARVVERYPASCQAGFGREAEDRRPDGEDLRGRPRGPERREDGECDDTVAQGSRT